MKLAISYLILKFVLTVIELSILVPNARVPQGAYYVAKINMTIKWIVKKRVFPRLVSIAMVST